LDSTYGFTVALTLRTGFVPDDRVPSTVLLAETTGMWARVEQLLYWLHVQRHALLCYINNRLPAGSQPLIEPFDWQGTDAEPRWEGPDWFSADPTGPDSTKFYGLVCESRFLGGRRLQAFTPL
jgi:hypothetical protein